MELNNRDIDILAYVDNFKIHEDIESIAIKESEKSNYFLSIFIPTYKRPKELKEAIDSALNQEGDLFEYEVVVVDNNPERGDETEQLLATYTNSNLSYYKNSENLGMAGNWNRGYLLAKGEWVTMLHDDDMLYPYFLKISQIYLEKSSCAFIPACILGDEYIYIYHSQPQEVSYKELSFRELIVLRHIIKAPIGLTVRKEDVIATGGFNQKLYPEFDLYWYIIFVNNKFQFNQILQPLSFCRTTIGESHNLETIRLSIINAYFFKARLLKRVTRMPYCLINCILGIEAIRRDRSVKKQGIDCGFKLSDINLNSRFYADPKFGFLRLLIWRLWQLYARIITFRLPKHKKIQVK